MTRSLRALLFVLMFILCGGFVSIVSAIARETGLEAGETPGPPARRRGRIAGVIAACVVAGAMSFGNWWWGSRSVELCALRVQTAASHTHGDF